MRRDLFYWLIDLNSHFQFPSEVCSTAGAIFDTFLSSIKVKPKYTHIIGVCSFLIASKVLLEETIQPTMKELVSNSGDLFTANDIRRMEVIICKKLNWNIRPVTAQRWLEELFSLYLCDSRHAPNARVLRKATATLNECSSHHEVLHYSQQSLALNSLSMTLEQYYDQDVVAPFMKRLCRAANMDEDEVYWCRHEMEGWLSEREDTLSPLDCWC